MLFCYNTPYHPSTIIFIVLIYCGNLFHSSAALAGSTASAITNPLELAKVRLQVEVRSSLEHSLSANHQKHHHTLWYMLQKVYRQEGLAGWWRGAFARVLFHTPSTAITMALFEGSKQWWNDQLYPSKAVIAR